MGSFSMDDFVGNGILKEMLPKLREEGWDDVPTLKTMELEDMDAINMTQQYKDALEIRTYLHDRALMQYADKLESSGKTLSQLQALTVADLSSLFTMKRGHVARFTNRNHSSSQDYLPIYPLPPRANKPQIPSRNNSTIKNDTRIAGSGEGPINAKKAPISNSSSSRLELFCPNYPHRASSRNIIVSKDKLLSHKNSRNSSLKRRSFARSNTSSESSIEQSIADLTIKEGHVFKGVVAYSSAEPRACGCISPPPVVDNIAPYSAIENISVNKLTPEYKIGMERLVENRAPPMKALELWKDKPAVFLCIRRPGCIMCRAEAHKLYAQKPIFDALGVQLFAVLHEQIESEVKDFWPRYWGGVVLLDKSMDFFKALGGGKLHKEKFFLGFLFNPRAIANYKRAKQMGIEQTFKGEGEIKGGLFLVGKGKSGIAYQFIERNFGDWAPLAEVIEVCIRMQNQQLNLAGCVKEPPEFE